MIWTVLIPTIAGRFVLMGIAGFSMYASSPYGRAGPATPIFWPAFGQAGGIFSVFFKSGPVSWIGVIGWWIQTLPFAVIMTTNVVLIYRHTCRTSDPLRVEESLEGSFRPIGAR